MERLPPKVTGLSPMAGPPGTRIVVRGENFGKSGDDIVGLTINGRDCWPYLEWNSQSKIVTRCVKAFGKGYVIITTRSGGVGTSDLQFDCQEQTVGPTDESAVWVDEIVNTIPEEDKLGVLPGKIGESYIDFSSSNFNPHLYLLRHCGNIDLMELLKKQGSLKSDLVSKSELKSTSSSSNLAMLKYNLSTIMECLQSLEHLSRVMAISKDNSVEDIIKSIRQTCTKTHELFDPLIARRDLVKSIDSAMQVFRRNETLFNLPSAIETSIKVKNYDSVVKDISEVLSRLRTIDVDQNLTEKIQKDVTTKINKLKKTIQEDLHHICKCNGERSIDHVKKLVSHLNRLDDPVGYDIWIPMKEIRDSLFNSLDEKFDHYLKLSLETAKDVKQHTVLTMGISESDQRGDPPNVVRFVQASMKLFNENYYDIIALGQSYFDPKDEFSCRDASEIKHERLVEFEELMISKPIARLCHLLRLALVPDSSKLEKESPWPPDESGAYVAWLRHVLQSVIACHNHLTKVNLPPAARASLEDFREFVFELRVRSMQILFVNATRCNKNLHTQEDWSIDVDDQYGGRTKLPSIFEKNVIDTLRFANDTIFKTTLPDEKSILKRVDVQPTLRELAHSLINSFLSSLDQALIDSRESPEESNRLLVACKDSSRVPSKFMNRILITICNCQFTRDQVFGRLQDEFEKLDSIKMDRVFKVCSTKYSEYIKKISDKFCRIRCAELTKCLKEEKGGDLEDLQINLMIVNSQIFLIAPQLVNNLMVSIVNMIQKDIESIQARSNNKINNL